MPYFAFLAFLLFAIGTSQAGLVWNVREVELHPAINETKASGEFGFTNKGTRPITIASIETECGCTSAALDKRTYEPGEKGRIVATFNVGERTGKQRKLVYVYVKGERKPSVLTLVVDIPEALTLTPTFVYWKAGEPPVPKIIHIAVKGDNPLPSPSVASSSDKYRLRLETLREGYDYSLVVTPENTQPDTIAVLTITIQITVGHKVFHAYAQVKAPLEEATLTATTAHSLNH